MAKKQPKHNRVTNVTPLSRAFAGLLFVFLPIIAFLMGFNYQQEIDEKLYILNEKNERRNVQIKPRPTDATQEAVLEVEEKTATPASKSAR